MKIGKCYTNYYIICVWGFSESVHHIVNKSGQQSTDTENYVC